jgi:hypothetical protein
MLIFIIIVVRKFTVAFAYTIQTRERELDFGRILRRYQL